MGLYDPKNKTYFILKVNDKKRLTTSQSELFDAFHNFLLTFSLIMYLKHKIDKHKSVKNIDPLNSQSIYSFKLPPLQYTVVTFAHKGHLY